MGKMYYFIAIFLDETPLVNLYFGEDIQYIIPDESKRKTKEIDQVIKE